MKQWRFVTLVLLAIVALALGACSTATPATQAPAEEAPAEEAPAAEAPADATATPVPVVEGVTNLILMGWSSSPAENELLQQIIDQFNTDNPDLNVVLSQVPDYDTKLQVSLAGGSPPDVFYVDAFKFFDLQGAGALEPLGDQIGEADDFYPNLAGAFTADGTLVCPPKDFSTLGLIYNKGLFEAAGVAEPTAEWTWDDLRAAAEALTDAEQGVYGMSLSADLARWLAFLYQAGGSITSEDFSAMTLNTPEALAAMDFYVGMVKDGFAKLPADLDSGWPGEAFGRARAAMVVEGNWIVPFMADQYPDVDFGIVELPAGPGGKATLSYTVCYAVAANGKNKEASVRLVNYLAGPEGMKAWTDLGLAMPTRQSLEAGWLEQYPNLEPFVRGAEYARPWQFQAGFQEVLDTINAGIQQAFTGAMTTQAVLDEAQMVGEEVLAR